MNSALAPKGYQRVEQFLSLSVPKVTIILCSLKPLTVLWFSAFLSLCPGFAVTFLEVPVGVT